MISVFFIECETDDETYLLEPGYLDEENARKRMAPLVAEQQKKLELYNKAKTAFKQWNINNPRPRIEGIYKHKHPFKTAAEVMQEWNEKKDQFCNQFLSEHQQEIQDAKLNKADIFCAIPNLKEYSIKTMTLDD